MGCVFAYVIILTLIGPENLGHKFGVAHDKDMEDAAGSEALAAVVHRRDTRAVDRDEEASSSSDRETEKGTRGVQKEV